MPDIFTPEKRSEVMSLIKGSNTKPELLVFRHLRRNKIYFQKHYRRVKGRPDIALPRRKLAVFVDGDFWHGRHFAERRHVFEERQQDYWIAKIERNLANDVLCRQTLEAAGWKVLRVWESDLMRKRTRDEHLDLIVEFLRAA